MSSAAQRDSCDSTIIPQLSASLYKPDVMRYSYDVEKAERIESKPGRFIIMFPDDWHVAKVKTGLDDQKIRVVVVKMPYKG